MDVIAGSARVRQHGASVDGLLIIAMSASKRPRTEASKDRIKLDVGGTLFTSSISTLTANSQYFAALFSRWEEDEENLFLDRDPDSFRVLLSCMRHKRALLPEHDKDLFKRVLLDAQFYGLDWLENEVMAQTMDHADDETIVGAVETYDDQRAEDTEALDDYNFAQQEAKVKMFRETYGSVDAAFKNGVLPAQFFKPINSQPKIKQLIPANKGDEVVFFATNVAREARKAVCLALVEDWHGDTHIEPIVRRRGIVCPEEDFEAGRGGWLTTASNEQIVTASEYMGGEDEDGDKHWAFAYSCEREKEMPSGSCDTWPSYENVTAPGDENPLVPRHNLTECIRR